MKSWYSIKALEKDDAYEVAIYDEIGFWGITAKQFLDDFKKIPASAKIFLRVNSPGGDIFDGTAIYNVIKRHDGEVVSTIDGLAASMASVIALAADRVIMPENAFMMIHNPWGIAWGDADDMRDQADLLEKIKSTIVNVYAGKSGMDDKEVAKMMDAETWLTGAEAKEMGLIDEVVEPVKLAATSVRLNRFAHIPKPLSDLSETLNPPIDPVFPSAVHAPTAASPGAAPAPSPAPRIEIVDSESERQHAALESVRHDFQQVIELCSKAGVIDLASEFLTGGLSIEDIRARLADADAIRGACVAIGLPGGRETALARASGYIRSGLNIAEVREQLNQIKTSLDQVEIDNKFAPDSRATKNSGVEIDLLEIYARRRAKR